MALYKLQRRWKFGETEESGAGTGSKDGAETSGVLRGFTEVCLYPVVTLLRNLNRKRSCGLVMRCQGRRSRLLPEMFGIQRLLQDRGFAENELTVYFNS